MRKLIQSAFVGAVLLLFLHFVTAQDRRPRRPVTVKQPIAFSHRQHAEARVQCSHCHSRAEIEEQAGLPSVSDCAECHRKIQSGAALMRVLTDHETLRKDIPWVRVYDLPDYVFFSHKAHLRIKADCRTCHGPVERRTVLWKEREISMKACVACHKENRASTECNYCHELNR